MVFENRLLNVAISKIEKKRRKTKRNETKRKMIVFNKR